MFLHEYSEFVSEFSDFCVDFISIGCTNKWYLVPHNPSYSTNLTYSLATQTYFLYPSTYVNRLHAIELKRTYPIVKEMGPASCCTSLCCSQNHCRECQRLFRILRHSIRNCHPLPVSNSSINRLARCSRAMRTNRMAYTNDWRMLFWWCPIDGNASCWSSLNCAAAISLCIRYRYHAKIEYFYVSQIDRLAICWCFWHLCRRWRRKSTLNYAYDLVKYEADRLRRFDHRLICLRNVYARSSSIR